MVRHLVVPSVCVSPREECAIEPLELTRRIGSPFVGGVVVIENDQHASGFGSLFHLRNSQSRFWDPLECPCGGDHVELRPERQSHRVTKLKLQVRKHGVSSSRYVQKHLVS